MSEFEHDILNNELQQPILFPLSDEAIGGAIDWLSFVSRNPGILDIEKNNIRLIDPEIAKFLDGMSILRGWLQLSTLQSAAYGTGAAFGYNLLVLEHERQSTMIPFSLKASRKSYFRSLVKNSEDPADHSDEKLEQSAKLLSPLEHPTLTPQCLIALHEEGALPISEEQLAHTFQTNSANHLDKLLNFEPGLAEGIYAIREIVGEDGLQGFLHATSDDYWLFRGDYENTFTEGLLRDLDFLDDF